MAKVTTMLFLVVVLLTGHPPISYAPTFFGKIPSGYQYVEKGGSGYGVYVPVTFDPTKESVLIFAFGRSPKDLQLLKDELQSYADLWKNVADERGYVVVVPFWEPVIVENNQHTERYYLDMLREVKMMYNAKRVLMTGFGLGSSQAMMLATLYPREFTAVATIARASLGDPVINAHVMSMMRGRSSQGFPPLLMVHGENDGVAPTAWAEDQKSLLEQAGVEVTLRIIPGMADEHLPKANPIILDWFERL